VAFDDELAAASSAEAEGALSEAWRRLERAHVLSQPFAGRHLSVHCRMLGFAWRRRDLRELAGQLPRILLAAPGSLSGRAPRGNTGGASVGIFTPMAIPADLAALLSGGERDER
jgi:hypothetical protein